MAHRTVLIEVDQERCKGCELCVEACPRRVLAMSAGLNALGYRPVSVARPEVCNGCKICTLVCPEVAFTLSIPEVNGHG